MRRIIVPLATAALLAVVATGVVLALNYEGEAFCQDSPAWPNGTYLGQMHPYHSDFYRGYAERRGWDPCTTWATDQRHSAIRGLRELGYAVVPPGESSPAVTAPATWRGLTVSAEHRCAPYAAGNYPYAQSVEPQIVAQQGGNIYGPYTGTWFASTAETDIEHIVARSEAHDSGLCAADADRRRAFASDLVNLTLASPAVNRQQKSGKDAAEWMPGLNQCWFANQVLQARVAYGLTIDRAEADALERVLAGCSSTEMVFTARAATTVTMTPTPVAAAVYASCEAAEAAGAPRIQGSNGSGQGFPQATVPSARDGDGDGVVCER